MRGISEERLIEIMAHYAQELNISDGCLIDDLIQEECTELNPWQPIETAPLNKRLRLYSDGAEPSFGKGQTEGQLYIDSDRKYFTHWQELPDDPK